MSAWNPLVDFILSVSLLAGKGFCNKECWDACPGSVYSGTLSVTVNGKTCQTWSSKTPHNHTFDKDVLFPDDDTAAAALNYCRDPRGDGQPGCFTTDPLVPYEFCDVPICEYTCCIQESNTSYFGGKVAVTQKGLACQPWLNQTSFQYNYSNNSLFPQDRSAIAAQNYCRDPDKSGVLWCYTASGRFRRDLCSVPICNNFSVNCGGTLTEPTGWFSPLFVNSQFEISCHWTVIVDDDHWLNLIIEEMNLFVDILGRCIISAVKIYEGTSAQGPPLAFLCGDIRKATLSLSNNTAFIHFEGVDDRRSNFFNISYFQIKALKQCQETLTDTTGWFTPPDTDKDGRFENQLDCWWIIKANHGLGTQLAVLDMFKNYFQLATDQGLDLLFMFFTELCHDYLKIYEGEDYKLLGKFCLGDTPPFITSDSNQLAVYFHSDYTWTSDGFAALYSATLNRTEYMRGQLKAECGLFSPSKYWFFFDWTIKARDGYMLQLFIVTMEMYDEQPCQLDMLEIYDGGSWFDELIGIYCGVIPPPTITASSQELLVLFSTSIMHETDKIFLATYRTYPASSETFGYRWPEGDYSLPTSIYGCNDPEADQWQYGYINISFVEPVLLYERSKGQIHIGKPSLLLGPYGPHNLQLNFCTKVSDNVMPHEQDTLKWPPGQYAVYGSEKGCPEGLESKTLSRHVPAIIHVNKDGFLPKLNITTDAESRIDFLLCYKSDETSNRNFDYMFPYAVLSYTQGNNKSPRHRRGPDIFKEELFLMTTDIFGNQHEHELLQYEIFMPERLEAQFTTKRVLGLKYMHWELGYPDEYYTNEQTAQPSLHGTVPAGNASGLDPEWLLYDLGQAVSLATLRIIKVMQLSYLDGRYAVLPDILVSDMKWSFLSCGATLCLQSVYRLKHIIEISCLNGQPASVGRYIVLYMRQPTTINILQRILSKHWRIQILFAERTHRCRQHLGMNDGSIADFQIAASSEYESYMARNARPHDHGWCMQPDDEDPFLHVDLLVSTNVEGIIVYNWWELYNHTNMTYLSSEARGMGVYKFSIESDQHQTKRVKRIYSLDLSMPYNDGQMFLFVTPVTTRYLKIRPLEAVNKRGVKCLRFELVGCLRLERTTNDCGERATGQWVMTDNIFIPGGNAEPSVLVNISSPADCIQECQEWSKLCYLIVYDREEKKCVWYDESPSQHYQLLSVDANQFVLSRICSFGVDNEVAIASSYVLEGTPVKNFSTIYDDVAVSFGYPFHYVQGYAWSWKIVSDNQGVSNIIFTDISLNIFEADFFIDDDQRRYSDKIDRIYVLDYFFNDNAIFSDLLLREMSPPVCVIDATYNDKVTYCRSIFASLVIMFRTWANDAPIKHRGRGFRAKFYTTDLAFCPVRQDSWTNCKLNSAYLASGSYIGTHLQYDHIFWDIFPVLEEVGAITASVWYIEVTFEEFDIGCKMGSTFRISHLTTTEEDVCNLNRPVGMVRSYGLRVKLQYRYSLRLNSLPEGFVMSFRRVDIPIPIAGQWTSWSFEGSRNITLYGENILAKNYMPTKHRGECSDLYKKCYIYFVFEYITWEDFQTYACEENGLSMVSFHSKEEQQFVADMILRREKDYFYTLTKPSYLNAFIGLRRERRTNGQLKYEWINRRRGNEAVTFTTWDKGEPSPSSEKNCALMNLKISQDQTWTLIDCLEITMAPYGICEAYLPTYDNQDYQEQDSDYLNTDEEQETILSFFHDSSIYYSCEGGDFISILGLCDGNIDCFYGDDEVSCKVDPAHCTEEEYRCHDGTCVQISALCDHFIDCPDASDENCYFPPCLDSEFRCIDGECIGISERCDSKNDCIDGTDELNCEESTCSNRRSLMCDSKCIANSSICDGEKDCLDGKDEENCPEPASCLEWWRAGYTESGFYTVYGGNIECDFTQIANGTILTKYHAIDYERTINLDVSVDSGILNEIIYQDERVMQKMKEKNGELVASKICYQSVDQLCSPYKQLLYSLNEMPGCRCIRYFKLFGLERIYIHHCHETQTESYYTWDSILDYSNALLYIHIDEDEIKTFKIKDPHTFSSENLRLKFHPIECLTQTVNSSIEVGFPCGQGLTTTKTLRCLYDRDVFGNIKGCRSLAHLQNCESFPCPSGYYKCRDSFCLKRRFTCDGEVQCTHGDDEQQCDNLKCRRQYRCLNSTVCLSAYYLCDGYRDCPQGDDERLCDFRNRCPVSCSCVGAIVYCNNGGTLQNTSNATDSINSLTLPSATRALEISFNTNFFLGLNWELQRLYYLAHLNMSKCDITSLSLNLFQYMYNLQLVDLSYNRISVLPSLVFKNQKYLRLIRLDGNSEVISFEPNALFGLLSMTHLNLQSLHLGYISENAFASLHLEVLDLSSSKIERIEGGAFQDMTVEKVFLTGSEIKWFSNDMFKGIVNIGSLVSDAYKFCCIKPTFLPSENCFPQKEIFSSCFDLIGNEVMRPLMWIICLGGLLGNTSTFIYRVYSTRVNLKRVFGILVANLAFSDSLACLNLLIILSYDSLVRSLYSFVDEYWRSSVWCQCSRVLSTVSCQVSITLLCLISVDRLLVIKYPYGQIRLQPKPTTFILILVWSIAGLFAFLPFLSNASAGKEFSSKTSICLASLLSTDAPATWMPSIVVFSFGLISIFCFVVYGVYVSQRELNSLRKALAGKIVSRTNDLKISRNLILLELINLLLYVPVGTTGLLVLLNRTIPESLYIWTTQVIFPITSAINPFLYTLMTIIRKRTFQPDNEEQDRLKFYTKDTLETSLTIWRHQHFLKPRTHSEKFTSLQDVLQSTLPSRECCMKILIGCLRCLKDLHDRDLIQVNFSVKDLQLKNLETSKRPVFLECRPKFAKKDYEKAANMETFARIVRKLIQQPQGYHRRNVSSRSDKLQSIHLNK